MVNYKTKKDMVLLLRRNGKPYSYIVKKMKISLSSVRRWVKDLKLTKKEQNKLSIYKKAAFKEKRLNNLLTGKKNYCKKHGWHSKWRIILNRNTIRCMKCDSDKQRVRNKENPFKAMLRHSIRRSKELNRKNNLTELFLRKLYDKQNGKCALSGIKFDDKDENKMSLDRIDNKRGYLKDNVQLIIFNINRMKSNINQETFINICNLIDKNNPQ